VSVFALGLNHTTAPLDLRGRLAFAPEQMAPALQGLRERLQRSVPEAALVSTCNRTELYVAAAAGPRAGTGAPGGGLAGRAGRHQRRPVAATTAT
jgi:glutamyl-tRNA reductase